MNSVPWGFFGGTNFIVQTTLVSSSLVSHTHYYPSLKNWDNQCSSDGWEQVIMFKLT